MARRPRQQFPGFAGIAGGGRSAEFLPGFSFDFAAGQCQDPCLRLSGMGSRVSAEEFRQDTFVVETVVFEGGGGVEFEPAFEEHLGGQGAGRMGGEAVGLVEQGADFVRIAEGGELQGGGQLLGGRASLAQGIKVTLHHG